MGRGFLADKGDLWVLGRTKHVYVDIPSSSVQLSISGKIKSLGYIQFLHLLLYVNSVKKFFEQNKI